MRGRALMGLTLLLAGCTTSGPPWDTRGVAGSRYHLQCEDVPHYCFLRAQEICGRSVKVQHLYLAPAQEQMLIRCR